MKSSLQPIYGCTHEYVPKKRLAKFLAKHPTLFFFYIPNNAKRICVVCQELKSYANIRKINGFEATDIAKKLKELESKRITFGMNKPTETYAPMV